ncbi:MAG: O-antigen ligase family protein, partial [Guyparkeria sp.]
SRPYMHLHFYGLDVLVGTGLIGLAAFVVAYLGLLLILLREGVGLAAGGALTAVGLALFPFNTHFGFYSSYTLAIVWPIVGLAMAMVVSRPSAPLGIGPGDHDS